MSAKKRIYSDSISDLADMPLLCREKNHYWTHVTDKVLASHKGEPKLISRDWVCGRCSTAMYEELHIPSFDIVARKYYYVDGYLLSKRATDGTRVNIRDIRKERLERSGLIKTAQRSKKTPRLRVVS